MSLPVAASPARCRAAASGARSGRAGDRGTGTCERMRGRSAPERRAVRQRVERVGAAGAAAYPWRSTVSSTVRDRRARSRAPRAPASPSGRAAAARIRARAPTPLARPGERPVDEHVVGETGVVLRASSRNANTSSRGTVDADGGGDRLAWGSLLGRRFATRCRNSVTYFATCVSNVPHGYRPPRRRDRIVDGDRAGCCATGASAISPIEDVMAEAGLSRTVFYRHFAGLHERPRWGCSTSC